MIRGLDIGHEAARAVRFNRELRVDELKPGTEFVLCTGIGGRITGELTTRRCPGGSIAVPAIDVEFSGGYRDQIATRCLLHPTERKSAA